MKKENKQTDSMRFFEKRVMFSFGVIVFFLIVLISSVSIFYYNKVLIKEHDNLTSTIANLLQNSIGTVNFSQNDDAIALLKQFKEDNLEISYIMILNDRGKIIAHSDSRFNNTFLETEKMFSGLKALQSNQQITKEILAQAGYVKEIDMPFFAKGLDKPHLLRVGITNANYLKNLDELIIFVLGLAIVCTTLALFYIRFLSGKLASPVKALAQKFSGILEYSPMQIIIKDKDGKIADISKNCYDLLPENATDTELLTLASLIPKDELEALQKDEEAVFNEEKIISTHEYTVCKPGDDRTILLTTFPVIHDAKGEVTHLCHISIDITERIHLREQLMQSQKMESLGHLAGGIAHDFNNIISVIMGYTSLLMMDEKMPADNFEDLNNIKEASLRASALVRKLMAFSRRDSIKPKKSDVNLLIKETETLFFRLIPDNIKLKMRLISYPIFVLLDENHFEQVLVNLVNNSIDAIGKDDGDIIVTSKIKKLSAKTITSPDMDPGKYVEVSISDTGCGMEKKLQAKIFEPFFTTKSVGKGSGLGLAMVYGMVKQLKGDIKVESEPGKGAIFKIYLPIMAESDVESEEKQKVNEAKHAKECHGNKTILVAEDEAFVRALVKKTLEKYKYKVIVAENGQQAIDMALTNKIDLLLTDIMMPFKNGPDAYAEIKQVKRELPCIYMSGYTSDLLKESAEDAKTINFLPKPLNLDQLLTMVQEVLKKASTKPES